MMSTGPFPITLISDVDVPAEGVARLRQGKIVHLVASLGVSIVVRGIDRIKPNFGETLNE